MDNYRCDQIDYKSFCRLFDNIVKNMYFNLFGSSFNFFCFVMEDRFF